MKAIKEGKKIKSGLMQRIRKLNGIKLLISSLRNSSPRLHQNKVINQERVKVWNPGNMILK